MYERQKQAKTSKNEQKQVNTHKGYIFFEDHTIFTLQESQNQNYEIINPVKLISFQSRLSTFYDTF